MIKNNETKKTIDSKDIAGLDKDSQLTTSEVSSGKEIIERGLNESEKNDIDQK